MKRVLLGLVLVAACESPGGPPPPADSLLPPRESASSCGPSGMPLFPQLTSKPNGYMADLEEGGSCGIYLEQDDCVVAIFRDCTYYPGSRQWIGTVHADTTQISLTISPTYEPAPMLAGPQKCTGTFLDPSNPRASTTLTCEGNGTRQGLYLERRDVTAKPFGEQVAEEQWPINSFQTMEAIPAATTVVNGAVTETWVAVNWAGGGMGGGVWRHSGPVEAPRITMVDDDSNVYAIDAAPNGKVIVALGKTSHLVRVYDVATHSKVATATVSNMVKGLAATSSSTFMVATASIAYVLKYTEGSTRLTRVGGTFRPSPGHEITSAEWAIPAGKDSVPFVISTARGDDGELIGLNDDMTVAWRSGRLPSFDVLTMEVLPGKARVGMILWGGSRDFDGPDQANQYYEVNPASGRLDPLIPIPFFSTVYAMSYDVSRDRVYIGGRFGNLAYIDRVRRRADQSFTRVREPATQDAVMISAIAWDPTRERLYVVDPKRGVIDSFKLSALTP